MRAMDSGVYQQKTDETAIYPHAGTGHPLALAYAALGLAGEAGEVANKVKKILRDDAGELTADRRQELAGELGDVAWYLARMATELGADLGSLLQANVDKLSSRKERGTLSGSGDSR
jgi:NTP pyrophosphatase (non-canonical NTP hydrolase)